MLNDTQFGSIVQRFLHRLCIVSGGYVCKEMFFITWPSRAYPWNGSENVRRRHKPANNNNNNYY